MLHIYYAIFEQVKNANDWQVLLKKMPMSVIERIDRYRQNLNKYQLVYGRLLLQKICWDLGYADFNLEDIQYTSFNKPFWRANIDFSIAHSGQIVGCALSTEGTVGLDIEKIQSINISNFKHILNAEDQLFLSKSTTINKDFFKIWTIKEAVSKADGRGLGMDVKDIYIGSKQATCFDNSWLVQEITVHPDYKCHFAVETSLEQEIVIKKVVF